MTTTTIPAASRRRRMLGWLSRDEVPTATVHCADPVQVRAAVHRQLFDDVGALIFAHGLTPSVRTYGVLHAYLSGEDPRLVAAIGAALRDVGRLSDATVTRIAAEAAAAELQPEALTQIAEALEARIGDCLAAAGQSLGHAETFGSALNQEAAQLERAPHEALQRIIALTRDAVEATRLVEAQLRHTREEADRLRQELQRARRAAEHDHLTALPNRRSFEKRLQAAIAAGKGPGTAIALCDIDDFKQINDRFGHPAGDRVLKFVAGFLQAQLKRKVMVARYGGEEFAILFENMPCDEALAALDGVRERLSQRSLVHQESGETIGHVTFSAGLTAVAGGNAEAALSRADLALYAAKNGGKNRIMCAGDDDAAAA